MEEKKCSKCKKVKLFSEFYKDKNCKYDLSCYCKTCVKELAKINRHSEGGLLAQIYKHQKESSVRRGHLPPNYTKEQLSNWCRSQKLWSKLLGDWSKSGYKKELIPSIDRLDDYKPYTLDNIQLMTWAENNSKANKDRKSGINNKINKAVLQYTKEGVFIKEHYSIIQAARDTGLNNGHIVSCCKGRKFYKTSGGFVWKYKN